MADERTGTSETRREVASDGAARDGSTVELSGDDVGDDGSDTGERGGGDGEMRRGGAAATVGGNDTGSDGRDDGEGVSRGGTPAPLSAESGVTSGGGAAGSEVREASERAGASGTSGEAIGGDDDAGASAEPTVRGRGKKSKKSKKHAGDFRRWEAARRR